MIQLLKRILAPRLFFYLRDTFRVNFDEIATINKFLDFKKGIMFDVGSLDGSSFMPFLLKDWGNIIAFTNENDYNEFRRKNKI